jgi:hypothetical protein
MARSSRISSFENPPQRHRDTEKNQINKKNEKEAIMDRLVETWVTYRFTTPFECAIKLALMSGADGEYDITSLKPAIKARIIEILEYIEKELGQKASLFVIANTLMNSMAEASYVEISKNGEDGVTIYRETE